MSLSMRVMGVLTVILLVGIAVPGQAAEMFRPDVVIIKLKPEAAKTATATRAPMATGLRTLDRLNAQFDVRGFHQTVPATLPPLLGHDRHGLGRFFTVELAPGTNLADALAAYTADPNVETADPDYIMPMHMVPNDPSYSLQWTHDWYDKDIDTPAAWDWEVGDSTVLVGIVDSGVLHSHADLKWSIWVNPGEDLDGDGTVWDADDINGFDDDGNGYVDDLIGYDFLGFTSGCWTGEDCDGPDNNPTDFAGHGTHVGGIVAATTGNGIGVAGIAGGNRSERRPGVKLMALRAGYLANDGKGYVVMSACAEAINYAVSKGVSVINCSWGTSGPVIRAAVLNAVSAGVVVCKSSGNDNVSDPDVIDSTYGVLAVSALTKSGTKAGYSNYGTWVDISAPGSDIYNTYADLGVGGYASLSGTSMASPTVAGVAALLKSHHSWFTKTQIDTILVNYVDDIYVDNPGYVGLLGSGRVNARRALEILTTADFAADVTFGDAPLTVNFTNTSPNAPSAPYLYTFGDGAEATTADASHTYDDPGVFDVTFTGNGPSGPHTRKRPAMIVAIQDTMEYGHVVLDLMEYGRIPIRVRNTHAMKQITIPFKLNGTPTVRIDSLIRASVVAGWDSLLPFDNRYQGEIVWRLKTGGTGTPLAAGNHIVGYLVVHPTAGLPGAVETVDSTTKGDPPSGLQLMSDWADFKPEFVGGSVTIYQPPCQCPCHGDPQCDGVCTVQDVVKTVEVAFRNGTPVFDPLCPREQTDVNCDAYTTVQDVVKVVNVAFRNGDPLTEFCDPCE